MGSMSGITSVLDPLLRLGGLPGALIGTGASVIAERQARDALRSQQDLALRGLQQRQGMEEAQSAQDAALAKSQIAAEAAAADARRKTALRRAVARQKTLFSSQGLSAGDGSGEAVLLGLYDESRQDEAAAAQSDALRVAALDQNLAQRRQKNLLEAQLLADQQNLTRVLNGY